MTIITRSGSSYKISVRDNKVYFKKGSIEGIVLAMTGLSVGDHLNISYHPVRHNIVDDDVYSMMSTTIVAIE